MERIYTGFESLDKYLKMEKGDLFVVGGRPAVGKTAFLISLLINLSNNGLKCKFFSLEMFEKDLKAKIIKAIGNDKEKAKNVFSNIIIDDEFTFTMTSENIISKIDENVQVVLIDYLQLLNTKGKNTKDNLRELKEMAKEKNVVIIVATSISRVFESYRIPPKLSTDWLINKKRLWQNFDMDEIDEFIFIDRPDRRLCFEEIFANEIKVNVADIVIIKNKNDVIGTIECGWDEKTWTFQEALETP